MRPHLSLIDPNGITDPRVSTSIRCSTSGREGEPEGARHAPGYAQTDRLMDQNIEGTDPKPPLAATTTTLWVAHAIIEDEIAVIYLPTLATQ